MTRPQCWPLPLPSAELIEWIALRRVHGGGVVLVGCSWVDFGRAVPCYLPDRFDDLHRQALIALADDDGAGRRRAVMTRVGLLRYVVLCARRGVAVEPPTGGLAPRPSAARKVAP